MQVIQYSAHDQWYQDDSYHYLVHDIDSGFVLLLSERFRRVANAYSSRPQSCFLWRMPSATHNTLDACIVHLHLQPQPGIFGCITHFWRLTQHVAEMWLTDDSLSSNVQCLVNSVVSSSIGVYPPQCVFKTLSLRITRCRHMFSVLVPSPVSRLRSRRTISRCCFAKLPIILGPFAYYQPISRFSWTKIFPNPPPLGPIYYYDNDNEWHEVQTSPSKLINHIINHWRPPYPWTHPGHHDFFLRYTPLGSARL